MATAGTVTAEQLAATQAWSLQQLAAAQQLAAGAAAATLPLWQTFLGWYVASQVADLATTTSQVAQEVHQLAGGLGKAYADELLRIFTTADTPVDTTGVRYTAPPLRNGADPVDVYGRVAAEHNRTYALTGDQAAATTAATDRLERMLATDVLLGRRDGEISTWRRAGVRRYARLLHPELAAGGSCGLCVAASDRIYKTGDLMPIHDGCNCSTVGLLDPRVRPRQINGDDLDLVYKLAGSNRAEDLKRVRVRTEEHGELGPVLVDTRHRFQGPGERDNVDELARARRRLQQAEAAEPAVRAAGDPGAIAYQDRFISSLRTQLAA